MAIGDIAYVSDKIYVDIKIDDEELTRNEKDIIFDNKLNIIEPLYDGLSVGGSVSINQTRSLFNVVSNEISLNMGQSLTSNEYTTSSTNLNYFPNLPSNDLKSIYYTDFINLTNAVSRKLKLFLESIKFLTSDLEQDVNYIKLQDLIDIKMPQLNNKISTLTSAVNENNNSFVEMVAQIKTIRKDSVAQIMINTYDKLDNKSSLTQYHNTATKYYDAVNKKYYRLFIENGKVAIQESLAPGAIIFTMISLASLFFVTYNKSYIADETILEEKLNLYKAAYHRTINKNIYVIKNRCLYIYNTIDMRLKAKIVLDADYFGYGDSPLASLMSQSNIKRYRIFNSPSTDNLGRLPIFIHETSNSKLLFIGESTSRYIMCINLEKLNDRIASLGSTILYDYNFLATQTNYAIIDVLDSDGTRLALHEATTLPPYVEENPNNVIRFNFVAGLSVKVNSKYGNDSDSLTCDSYISSIDFDETLNVLFVALSKNIILSFQIDCKTTKLLADDGEELISYSSKVTFDTFIRAGIEIDQQNSIYLRAIKFNRSENRLYLATYGYTNNKTQVHNIGYINILTPQKPLINVLTVSTGAFELWNNVCQLTIEDIIEETTDGVETYKEYIVKSDLSGDNYYQYYWKNTKYVHDKIIKPDPIVRDIRDENNQIVTENYYPDLRARIPHVEGDEQPQHYYIPDTSIVVGNTKRYMFIVHKVLSKNNDDYNYTFKHSLKVYDKVNDFYSYDTSNYNLSNLYERNNSQISIDNLPIINNYKTPLDIPPITQFSSTNVLPITEFSYANDLTLLYANITKTTITDQEIELVFESALNRYYANRMELDANTYSYVQILPTMGTEFIVNAVYSKLEQERNVFNIKCKFTPSLI